MKHLVLLLTSFVFFYSPAIASTQPPIEFAGLVMSGPRPIFALVNVESKESRFVRVGDTFCGFRVQSYSAETGNLALRSDGNEIVLHLRASTVTELKDVQKLNMDARNRIRVVIDPEYASILKGIGLSDELLRDRAAETLKLLEAEVDKWDIPEKNKPIVKEQLRKGEVVYSFALPAEALKREDLPSSVSGMTDEQLRALNEAIFLTK